MITSEKIYTGLCTLFCVFILLGNLTYQKFVVLSVPLLPVLELSVGAILYPLTFLLTDLIAEFYGKERANFCVRFAVVINVITVLIITGMDLLPATSWSKIDDATFHKVFGFYGVAFMGSMIACYTSQSIDISLYLWLRKLTKGKYLWLRNSSCSAICLFVDTLTVIGIMSLFGLLPTKQLWSIVGNSYSWKFLSMLLSTPLFCYCVKAFSYKKQHS
ncbi:queuosine precursor transporter [Candidatus Odyssella thessalonicensis]|uniref:queuosine precursor transporter n=1 Tax=Candidatus Odyssella thessalonicensis TaxID=84647 RepID=UPI000225C176|nr:queuosine precursor transporter [Candidatus Odyssella thessalonicensis]